MRRTERWRRLGFGSPVNTDFRPSFTGSPLGSAARKMGLRPEAVTPRSRRLWSNWAGNQSCRPESIHFPRSEADVCEIVARANESRQTVKAVGSGHSFTPAALTNGHLVDLSGLRRLVDVDRQNHRVTVEAGISIQDLNELLHGLGYALPNLGDIAYQTISGAVSTATHGTGRELGGIATRLAAMRLVAGDGSVLDMSPSHHAALFDAARVGVGALGIMTQVTLDVVPAFRLKAQEGADRLERLLESLDEHVDSNEHFEFFWIPHTEWALTKRNNRTEEPVSRGNPMRRWYEKTLLENYAFGAVCYAGRARPRLIPRLATALPSTGQTTHVDDSYRIFTSKRIVKFVEMEYAIPRAHCADALRRIKKMIEDKGHLVSFPVEVRFTAADDIPLSTASGRETAYIAVHMFKGMDHSAYFRDVAAIMADYDGRPHWGKMHDLTSEELPSLYPRWDEFMTARSRLDPTRTFANGYTKRVLGD